MAQLKITTSRKRLILLILLLVPSSFFALSISGFCLKNFHYVSDTELIISAIRAVSRDKQMEIIGNDSSIINFMKQNPSCCAIDRKPNSRSWVDVLLGWNSAEAEINFAVDQNHPRWAQRNVKYYKQFVALTACGQVMKTAYGTDTPTLEPAH